LERDVQEIVTAAVELAEERVEFAPHDGDLAAEVLYAGRTAFVRMPARL